MSVRKLREDEVEVLRDAANGILIKNTATRMGVDEFRVKYLRRAIAKKLGTKGITHTVAEAIRRRLIWDWELRS